MHCKSLWIKASAKCINVNVNICKTLVHEKRLSFLHFNLVVIQLYIVKYNNNNNDVELFNLIKKIIVLLHYYMYLM